MACAGTTLFACLLDTLPAIPKQRYFNNSPVLPCEDSAAVALLTSDS
jgi:hypothetical protein